MLTELSLVGAAIGVLVVMTMAVTSKLKKKLPPGPTGLPFFGQAFSIDPKTIHLTFTEWKRHYGDIIMTKLNGTDVLILNSLESIRSAFQSEEYKPLMNDRAFNFIGEKIMYSYKEVLLRRYDDEFMKLKDLMIKGLCRHGHQSAQFRKLMKDELDHLISKFEATEGNAVDPIKILMPSFCNIIAMILTGARYDDDHPFLQSLIHFEHYGDIMIQPSVHTVYKLLPWIRHCPCYHGRLYNKVISLRQDIYDFLILEVKAKLANGDAACFVHEMALEQERQKQNKDQEPWLTDEHTVGMAMDLINTSVLTTKAVMSGFIFLLLHFPEVQDKIQKEIDAVIGQNREPEIKDMTSLPYLRACILEILRYQTQLPLTAPHANLSGDVEFEGYTIPQNTVIFANLFAVHHDEQYWEDPWTFRPERFLDEYGQIVSEDHPCRKNLIPFGVGARVCVGRDMTYNRVSYYMTRMLQKVSFVKQDGVQLPSHDPRELYGQNPVLLPRPFECRVVTRGQND